MKLKGFISLLIGVILITAGICILVKKPPCLFAPKGEIEDLGNASEKSDLIRVDAPQPNETIESPLTIKGEARGYWFFEASFPVKLLDGKEEVIATAVAQAKSDWMTEDFVPFEANLEFQNPMTEKGTLILEKDNPSGLPENSDELRIPVIFQTATRTVKLYYYNPELDKDETGNISCSRAGLVAVERTVSVTKTPIQDTIRLLLQGELTDKEKANGIATEYPLEGVSLKGASLNEGVLTLQFDDPNNKTGGGSCRVGILWFQIEATAKQFPEVQEVKFIPEELFQP
ncbi:MAG: Gmad2 immunoglobulin-like domain-containing protein [Candidatus Pacebacteria bacterium]|nr:Gmad2 immunoglobulin-like domain-containing protein [Candidatus Paceibacterota bacterium]